MADTEKITINTSVVDLGKIDLLVEQGFYSTRTDFIRTAIRNQLNTHAHDIQETITRRQIFTGVIYYGAKDLEDLRRNNQQLDIQAMGLLILDKTISPDLALATIKSLKVFGVFKASPELKEALKERIS